MSSGTLVLFVPKSAGAAGGGSLGAPLNMIKFSELFSSDCCWRNFPCFRMAAIRLFASRFTLSSFRPLLFLLVFLGPDGDDLFVELDLTRFLGELLF